MSTKTIYMNEEGSEGGEYTYPNSDDEVPGCENSECSDQEKEEEYPEFYENLEIQESKDIKTDPKIKTKPRSMSIDSDMSDISKRPNFKCGSCKKTFLLDKNQKMIRCTYCGYRILFKLRTRQHITYKTE